ncbi:MAG TPA: hypothetical protein VIQ52_18990 [Arthrobacter sp.]
MVVFPAIGLLLWIAFLLVAFVLSGTIWLLCNLIIWLMDLKPRLTGPKPAASSQPNKRRVPAPARNQPRVLVQNIRPASAPAEPRVDSGIWPKWTASHRQYMDGELSLWQKQFDALNSRE